jgi:hypothetical protein
MGKQMRSLIAVAVVALLASPVRSLEATSLDITVEAATIGAFGLEVTVGSTCTSTDNLLLDSSDSPAQGLFEGCQSVTAADLVVNGPGAIFQAGSEIVLEDGFSIATDASFEVRLDHYLGSDYASIDDPSPIAEEVYNARFFVRADDLPLASGEEIDHLVAYSDAGSVEFKVVLEPNSTASGHALSLVARENGGLYSSTAPGQEIALVSGWNKVELEWQNGPGDGRFEVSVNDGPFSGLNSLTNDAGLVESIEWGAVAGSVATSSGKLQLDGFDSWR